MCFYGASFNTGVIIMDTTLKLNITKKNTMDVQELVLKLVMAGAVNQDDAFKLFVEAEKLRGIQIR